MTAPLFLRALAGEPVERFPVWMMRQAGRYLPGYRAVREKVPFLTLCRTPDLAAQVSLEPVTRFDVDAAIVFSDILVTADAMGAPVVFEDGGPRLTRPVRSAADAALLHAPDESRVRPTLEAISLLRKALPASKAVLGFSAAPFTLVAYLVEGGTSRDFNVTRRFLYQDRAAFRALLDRAGDALVPYLRAQARSGADALQLFDTWAGVVSPEDYRDLVAPAIARVIDGLGADRPPVLLFPGLGASPVLEEAAATGADALSVDWRTDLARAYARVGAKVRLQGNFDPAALYAPIPAIEARVRAMLDAVPPGRPHLTNLGHGILPDVPVEHAEAFVSAARAYRPRRT
ncbi:MAG TPA: uroporphyrinogen decarboxylase [Planctomycetota bacterium]|jgi:uroporphyrinogen decarboxylase|nr:uroporphyrinogen decarboxylase [Planctomycetota bacterium]